MRTQDHDRRLAVMKKANDALAEARTNLDHAVYNAHEAGCTWEDIGYTLGISRQAAHERFRDVPPPTPSRRAKGTRGPRPADFVPDFEYDADGNVIRDNRRRR